jgi:hypothetical protein
MSVLEDQISRVGRDVRRGRSVLDHPVVVPECELVVTYKRGSQYKVLVVRCRCMAGTRNVPARGHYAYDALGEVPSGELGAVKSLYREHLASRSAGREPLGSSHGAG